MTSSTNKFKLNKVKFGTVLHFVRIISMLSVDICKRYRVWHHTNQTWKCSTQNQIEQKNFGVYNLDKKVTFALIGNMKILIKMYHKSFYWLRGVSVRVIVFKIITNVTFKGL